jgi:hypothetical protein
VRLREDRQVQEQQKSAKMSLTANELLKGSFKNDDCLARWAISDERVTRRGFCVVVKGSS